MDGQTSRRLRRNAVAGFGKNVAVYNTLYNARETYLFDKKL